MCSFFQLQNTILPPARFTFTTMFLCKKLFVSRLTLHVNLHKNVKPLAEMMSGPRGDKCLCEDLLIPTLEQFKDFFVVVVVANLSETEFPAARKAV